MPIINFGGNEADGPLASLEVGAKYDTTYFPSDLNEAPYFIVFRAKKRFKLSSLADTKVKYIGVTTSTENVETGETVSQSQKILAAGIGNKVRAGVKAIGGFAKKLENFGVNISQPAHSFALPVPSSLQTSYNAQYNSSAELGVLGEAGRQVAENFQSTGSGNFISDLQNAFNESNVLAEENIRGSLANLGIGAAGAESATSALVGLLTGGVGGALVGASLGNIGTGALRGLGIARNPHIANVFTGVEFRRHNFQYKLIAKNRQESDTIRDLIRNFKYHMAPDYKAEGHVFSYPSQFEIILRAGDYLFKIGDSFLTSFDVNYTGEGGPVFFEDTNAPYSVTINMSFVEDTIVTKKEVRQGR
jgi:hypothetical protein